MFVSMIMITTNASMDFRKFFNYVHGHNILIGFVNVQNHLNRLKMSAILNT